MPSAPGRSVGRPSRQTRQLCEVARRDGSAPSHPCIETRQLHVEDRRLDLVQPGVASFQHAPVASLIAVHAEQPDRGRMLLVSREHEPSVTVGAEILGGVEAERRQITGGADFAPLEARTVRLGAVLDQRDAQLAAGRGQGQGVQRMAVQVRRDHRPRAGADAATHLGRLQQAGGTVAVRERHIRARPRGSRSPPACRRWPR